MIAFESIRQAVEEVAESNGAMCAVLFGSYARGTATRRSDIDVIFVEETDEPFLSRLDRYIGPLVDRLHTSVEALVYTPRELELMRDRPFISQALKEGITLYESGKVREGSKPVASASTSRPQRRQQQRRVG